MSADRRPFKVCERVYQVGGQDLSHGNDCCVYLVDGGGELALIDSGCGPGFSEILANIIRLGFEPDDIRTLLLTHCHIDHAGAAEMFRSECGLEIIAHELDCPPLESGDRTMTAAFVYGLKFDPLPVDRKLTGGDERLRVGDLSLTALLTPGHTPGSISAYSDVGRLRVLFGQDIHGPFHPDFGSDINAWRGSMARLLELNADVLCEGHFGVYSPKDAVRAYIQDYLDYFTR